MNSSVQKLHHVAQKPSSKIIGLMSGTSLDGLDIALCEISGNGRETTVSLEEFITKSYDEHTKRYLQKIVSVPEVSLKNVCLQHSWLGDLHGELVLEVLDEWGVNPTEIDCIASHGQTIYHAPKLQHGQADMPNATLQIGDGDHIAQKTGIITLSDFRQKHTACGGQGAPMAALVDQILYAHNNEERILLNIGGIANFTYLPAPSNTHQKTATIDTGPGNTLIDTAVNKYFNKPFDTDGEIAQQGSVQSEALQALLTDPYFQQPLPKTTGPEQFNLSWINKKLDQKGIDNLAPKDLIATLTQLTIKTISESIQKVISKNSPPTLYISGGGLHNPVLMNGLAEQLPNCQIKNFASIGCNPDAKEAVVFAVLANETLSGDGFMIDPDSSEKITFGKISFPD
ncbi:anhydro-N-acetylmuramic acid kinase [Fodinibius salinus]|uniref:Anhydro-N-acetylmuramic acid kinase n=1 Tax=Fodinibius salinus TaxID=860790 RepID=A0A5D3YJW6_9BACT|nr:anhydro-N-acetylmuramic acid kinase [Fodinibius salinus]TYP94073.1 anhydro-N-acetylmuramic acid kinase [Fodinibius salinus]